MATPENALQFERETTILAGRVPIGGRIACVGSEARPHARRLADAGCVVQSIESCQHLEAGSVDAVLLMGPLYLLAELTQRRAALADAFRVLREGGTLACTAAGRFQAVNHAVAFDRISEPGVIETLSTAVASGGTVGGGNVVHTYRPRELECDVRLAGFTDVEVLAVDAFFGLLADIELRLTESVSRAALLNLLQHVEREPAMLGITGTLMAIAVRSHAPFSGRHDGVAASRVPPSKPPDDHVESRPETDPIMMNYYSTGIEQGRLEIKNRLEFERTKLMLAERLPRGGRVLDVGGGPGTYAAWLAARGHQVALIDPVPLHVDQARKASRMGAAFEAHVGDARHLLFPGGAVEAVVMMGPLFHLVDRRDRATALREAWRVLRPDGTLIATAMGRFFHLCSAVVMNTIRWPQELERILAIADTGFRLNPPNPFPAYAHRPEELAEELAAAGFVDIDVLAIEGFFHLLGNVLERLASPVSRDSLFRVLQVFERDPALVGISGHIMAVARRP